MHELRRNLDTYNEEQVEAAHDRWRQWITDAADLYDMLDNEELNELERKILAERKARLAAEQD